MGQLTRSVEIVKAFVAKLTTSQQLLLASLAVLMLMTLFVVREYTVSPPMVPLFVNATSEENLRAADFAEASGVPHRVDGGGRLLVPASSREQMMARLTEAGALPADNTITFNNLAEHQSWTKNHQQNKQLEQIALQNHLASIIAKMNGIRSASVVVDVPTLRQFGRPDAKPTASVSIVSESGITQGTADAIAHLVASSRAGLTTQSVRIIDATTNRYFRPRGDSDFSASTNLELAAKVEERKRGQIYDHLSQYIPGVIVSVHAQVDTARRVSSKTEILPEGEGSLSMVQTESSTQRSEQEARDAGEAGPRSNTGIDINSGSGSGSQSSERTDDITYTTAPGSETTSTEDPGGVATRINAVVNVPRPYFVDIWKRQQGAPADEAPADEGAEPTDADLQQIHDDEIARITEEVQKLVDTSPTGVAAQAPMPSTVAVSMIPVSTVFVTPAGASTASASGGLIAGMGIGEVVKTAVLSLLALFAMFLIVMTALKSTKAQTLPKAEDLVGLPPALETDSSVYGEATQADAELTGLELSEGDIQHQELLKQIGELVKASPEQAAAIVGQWVTEDH